jgi:hypothetical protein
MSIDQATLGGFIGTQGYHRWSPLFRNMVLTDGAQYVAENGGKQGAYWLMDAIASHQPKCLKRQRMREFQVWELKLKPEGGCVLTGSEDSDTKPVVTQRIGYTDFQQDIKLFVEPLDERTWVILLPSEH